MAQGRSARDRAYFKILFALFPARQPPKMRGHSARDGAYKITYGARRVARRRATRLHQPLKMRAVRGAGGMLRGSLLKRK